MRWLARLSRRLRDDEGWAVVEFVTLAVLLLVPLIYLVMMLARLQAGSFAVTQAAREAGRAYVTADASEEAPLRARAAADIAFADQGFAGKGELALSCSATPCFTPEGEIVSTATLSVPLPLIPSFARDVVPLEVPVSATQVSTVPRYEVRS